MVFLFDTIMAFVIMDDSEDLLFLGLFEEGQ